MQVFRAMDYTCGSREFCITTCRLPRRGLYSQCGQPQVFQARLTPPRPSRFKRELHTQRYTQVVWARKSSEQQGQLAKRQPQRVLKQDRGPKLPGKTPPGPGSKEGWGFLDLKAYQQQWDVPWGAKELVLGFVAWVASFALVGFLFVPGVVQVIGTQGFASLSAADKANLLLINQLIETVVGIGVIGFAVRRYKPLSEEILSSNFSGPLEKPRGWLVWGSLGALLSPFIVGAVAFTAQSVGYDGVGGRGTAEGVASIISLDFPTYLRLFTVTAVLAPILEETVFRGFLLASLTKWMPVPAAVLVSAFAFGLAHLSPRDFPQLTALGILLGFTYVRSRNLLSPMLIHGTWNGTVLTVLYFLVSNGVDVQEFLAGAHIHIPLELLGAGGQFLLP